MPAPAFDPSKPFETPKFDPSEEFGVPSFDPEQDFKVLSPGIDVIESEPVPFGRRGVPYHGLEASFRFQSRKAEYFGFLDRAPGDDASKLNQARENLGFTPGRPEDMQRLVKREFGDRAKLKFHSGFDDYVVEFKDGSITPFNPPGLDIGDIRGMRANLGIFGAEVAAGGVGLLAGLFAGGPAGGVGGAAAMAPIGAGIGRYYALKRGKEGGLHELSHTEMLGEAAFEMLFAAGAEAVTAGGGVFLRRVFGSPEAKRFLPKISDKQIEEAIDYATDLASRTRARTGVELKATTGQVLRDVDPELARQVQTFETGLEALGQDVGSAARASQQAASAALRKEALGEVPETLERAPKLGEAIQKLARAETATQAERIAQRSIDDQAEALADQLRIAEAPPTLTNVKQTREYLRTARDDTFEQLGERYQSFWRQVPEDTPVNMAGLREVGTEWSVRLEKDIFPSLRPEDRQIVSDALKFGLKERKGLEFGPGGILRPITRMEDVGGNLDQVSRALSILKAELRGLRAAKGEAKAREASLVNDLIGSLSAARDDALEAIEPGLKKQLQVIDKSYRVAKERIDNSLINSIITKRKTGGFYIKGKRLFREILSDPEETENLMGLISDPEFGAFGQTETIKNGAMSLYRDRVIDGTMTHKSFMSQYKASLRKIFPDDMSKFSSLESAQNAIKLAERREKTLIRELEQSFEYKLQKYDPEDILDKVSGKLTATKKLKKLLKNHPDKWNDYKGLRARKFLGDVEGVDDFGNKFIDYRKIDTLIAKEKGELSEVFGVQFMDDLKLMRDIAKLRKIPKAQGSKFTEALKETISTPSILLWRASFARPLSRLGLITTSFFKLDREAARRANARLLSDPQALREAMNLYRRNAPWDKWRRFMINIGAIEIVRDVREALNEQ